MTRTADDVLRIAPVIPVLTIERESDAVPLAQALVRGGLPVLEVTLRTDCALTAIRRIVREVPDAVVGAGTITTPAQMRSAIDAGAEFTVSPGSSPELRACARAHATPFLPGVATASEILVALSQGFECLKFFPAEAAGATRALSAFRGPFPSARFCPTGGIDAQRAADYLALDNVECLGGSWMVPRDAVAGGQWPTIERLASDAAGLGAQV